MSNVPLVDREALARWKEDWNMPLECGPDYEFADDLLASGIIAPMPTREQIEKALDDETEALASTATHEQFVSMSPKPAKNLGKSLHDITSTAVKEME